jgi:SAM-dependent methyltransferase
MDVTNRFVLDFARRHGGRMLDYGCGRGEVVLAGRQAGMDIYGTDVFYQGAKTQLPESPFLSELRDGHIPFNDASFDLVTNNQVMEHVENLDFVLAEIYRVLKPGGTVLSIFPARDVWREGHIGIPFSHWFPRGSRMRFYYTWLLRFLGLGTWKEQAPTPREWAIDKLEWIDNWTRYRSRSEILAAYARYFTSELREREYISYRLMDRPSRTRQFLAKTVSWPFIAPLEVALFRKLAFLVITSRKAR